MFELLLLCFLLWKKFKLKKYVVEEEVDFLEYNPGLISIKELESGIKEMQKNIFQASMLIYTQISSFLNEKTVVIQFQMYGLGPIWKTGILNAFSEGAFQLAVAYKLVSKFRKTYPKLTMTSQDPVHLLSEVEYLRNNDVHVFERNDFSSNFFQNALTESSSSVSNPIMICYMIHFPINDFENFLRAHWCPEILSKIIFVGNFFDFDECNSEHASKNEKTTEFFKVVNVKPLPFKKPPTSNYNPNFTWGYHPFYGHSSDFWAWKCFHNTDVYMISHEDATKMIKKIN